VLKKVQESSRYIIQNNLNLPSSTSTTSSATRFKITGSGYELLKITLKVKYLRLWAWITGDKPKEKFWQDMTGDDPELPLPKQLKALTGMIWYPIGLLVVDGFRIADIEYLKKMEKIEKEYFKEALERWREEQKTKTA